MKGDRGYFHPRYALTRGEALAVLIRAVDQQKLDESMTPWYQSYIDRASELGLAFTNPKGFDQPITRGEFVEWLEKLSSGTTPSDPNLLGEWKLESYRLDDMMFAPSGQQITFTESRYSTRFCNTISGDYSARNGILTTGPAMSTMMACADSAITQMESGWDLSGATYSIQSTRGDPRTWLTITTKRGGEYRFLR
jgi:heat shock protein HslJ